MVLMSVTLGKPAGNNMVADYLTNPGNAISQAKHSVAKNMASLVGSPRYSTPGDLPPAGMPIVTAA